MSKKIVVKTTGSEYDIIIDANWIDSDMLKSVITNRKHLIVTDSNVHSEYGKLLEEFDHMVLPAGEGTKSFDNYKKLIDALQDRHFNRSSVIIAFGGGVIGDLTGFVASTYMRGINMIQIPTTLLAMVDSSVGGKVAINHQNAKNLIGSFYQPESVLVDLSFLNTLKPQILSDGMAEVIKYGLGFDENLFSKLEELSLDSLLDSSNRDKLTEIIARCCEIKAALVEADERDTGERQLLNLGHTIGHAIEQYYKYKAYTHGQAVSIGMAIKSHIAKNEGRLSDEDILRIQRLIRNFNLPENIEEIHLMKEILNATRLDKKGTTKGLKWVRINKIGECQLEVVDFETLIAKVLKL